MRNLRGLTMRAFYIHVGGLNERFDGVFILKFYIFVSLHME